MAVETVERSKSVLGFTNLSNNLPANLTELLDDIIRTLQIAVLRQGLVLAEEYSVEDVLTLIRNIAGSMTMTSTTSGPSVALLQSLNVNQGMLGDECPALPCASTHFNRSASACECSGCVWPLCVPQRAVCRGVDRCSQHPRRACCHVQDPLECLDFCPVPCSIHPFSLPDNAPLITQDFTTCVHLRQHPTVIPAAVTLQ